MSIKELRRTAEALVTSGKGILAADESTPTIKKRLNSVGVESTEENRRTYRDLLFATEGIEQYISGVILFEETIRQSTVSEGIGFVQFLEGRGIIPGIKVDKGAKPLAGSPGEKIAEGLDGLRDRLEEYRDMGARFAKWRGVITIGIRIPTRRCIRGNAHALARYAALCQEVGLVPIVEPEVLMDGDHTMGRSFDVTSDTLHTVFDCLYHEGVSFEGMILKPNMVLPGYDGPDQAGAQEVADATLRCLLDVVPASVPGICFLSGGQDDILATKHLSAMNALRRIEKPWKLSFSYGRALQQAALKTWSGDSGKILQAQSAFHHRARCNGAATEGKYSEKMEGEFAGA